MSKSEYQIKKINKQDCENLIMNYHYLKDISKGFKSGFNVGLIRDGKVVGVCIFTGFPVPELSKGMYGLGRDDQQGLYELSRLCIMPSTQESEHNIASWFVSRAIKLLKSNVRVRSILSYADSGFHDGIVYFACNFNYYGMTAKKKDFWILCDNGEYKKHSRGTVKGVNGEWRDRTRKHRFALTFDKKLKIRWDKQDRPEPNLTNEVSK